MVGYIWVLALALDTTSTSNWQLYSRADDVQVHFRYANGDTLEIQAEKDINSCAAAFLHLLEDTDRISDWVSNSRNATILEQPQPNTHIVHTEFRAIWPVLNRDMVTHSSWTYDAETATLLLAIKDASDALAEQKSTVRMTDVDGVWQLQESDNGSLNVIYRGQANPGGRIPRALARSTALRAIHQTFRVLDEVLLDYQRSYQHIPCEFADFSNQQPKSQ
ncbi:MAG: hypothetical protein LAT53_04740 [Idiomarina sp.]|nr:hypothetical protein [Idiomarina sp.]